MKSVFILLIISVCTLERVAAFAPSFRPSSRMVAIGLKRGTFSSMNIEGTPSLSPLQMSTEEPAVQEKNEESGEGMSESKTGEAEAEDQPSSAVELGLKERQAIMAAEAENSPAVLASKALNVALLGYVAYLFIDSIRLVVMGASGPPPL